MSSKGKVYYKKPNENVVFNIWWAKEKSIANKDVDWSEFSKL